MIDTETLDQITQDETEEKSKKLVQAQLTLASMLYPLENEFMMNQNVQNFFFHPIQLAQQ
jgi:hypothetical protein